MSFCDDDGLQVTVAIKKEKARKSLKKLKQTMSDIEPGVIEGAIIDEKLARLLSNADKKSPRVIGDDQVFELFGV